MVAVPSSIGSRVVSMRSVVGLPGTVGSEEAEDLAPLDLDADTAYGLDGVLLGVERLAQVVGRDDGFHDVSWWVYCESGRAGRRGREGRREVGRALGLR